MEEKEVRRQMRSIKLQNTVLLAFVGAVIVSAVACIGIYRYRHTFTVDKWNTDIENRTKIVDSLLGKYQLIGMTEANVIELLGEEDNSQRSSFKITRKEFPPETTLVYDLGVAYIDNEWLILSLQDGVVCDYCIDVS